MSAFLDIIASLLFGGALFGIVLTANDIATETQTVYSGDMLVQQMLTTTAQLVEGEFRNIGFGVPEREKTIMMADSSAVSFLCDVDRNGTIDTVKYSIGPTSELAATDNDLDRFLKRGINAEPVMNVGAVTVFRLRYFTRSGEFLSAPISADRLQEVYMVEVTMEVQSPTAPARDPAMVREGERDRLFSTSLWQQTRLASQNTRR
ncbi:MAG: hypothetical protein AB1428_06720 [Bacteroidota bacterium]